MKKILFNILLFIFIFIPSTIFAGGIDKVSYGGLGVADAGEEFYTNLTINFDGVNLDENVAIIGLEYDLVFDKNVLKPVSSDTTDFDDFYVENSSGWHVSSMVYGSVAESTSTKVSNANICNIGAYYCNESYKSIWYFVPIKNKDTTAKLQIKNLTVYGIDFTDEENPVVLQDKYDKTLTYSVKISKTGSKIDASSIKSDITKSSKVKASKTTISVKSSKKSSTTTTIKTSKKSSNTYLKTLTIEGYNIDFNKNKYKYDIKVKNDVNSLNVKYTLEDKKAKAEITGNDNLKEYGDKVKIEVTAEDLTKKEYTIFIDREVKKTKEKFSFTKIYKNIKNKIFASKKNKTIAMVIVGNIVLIILLIIIVSKTNSRKIDKDLDKM